VSLRAAATHAPQCGCSAVSSLPIFSNLWILRRCSHALHAHCHPSVVLRSSYSHPITVLYQGFQGQIPPHFLQGRSTVRPQWLHTSSNGGPIEDPSRFHQAPIELHKVIFPFSVEGWPGNCLTFLFSGSYYGLTLLLLSYYFINFLPQQCHPACTVQQARVSDSDVCHEVVRISETMTEMLRGKERPSA
jgi:hypothetical protein